VYVPVARFVIVADVCELLHKYEYGPLSPSEPIAVALPLCLLQYSGIDVAVAFTRGCVGTTNILELEHPFISLTDTVYVPPITPVIFCVVAVVDHIYDICPLPPVTFIVTDPLLDPVHVSSLVIPVIFGPGLFGTTPEVVTVQPTESVTVTV
jgi:hypothetical protein